MKLDETVTRANLAVLVQQIDELQARQARLAAERDGLKAIQFPALLTAGTTSPAWRPPWPGSAACSRPAAPRSTGRRRSSPSAWRSSGRRSAASRPKSPPSGADRLIKKELGGVEQLFKQQLVPIQRLTSSARGGPPRGRGRSVHIHNRQNQGAHHGDGVADHLARPGAQGGCDRTARGSGQDRRALERKVAAEDQLKRVDIRAPQDGLVHQMTVHTVGGVVTPAEPIMLIVPQADELVVEARIAPQDIDQVHVGQQVSCASPPSTRRRRPRSSARSPASPPT